VNNWRKTLSAASDGIYKNDSGILYFVKDGKILMSIRGKVFKTSLNHFIGAKHLQPLTGEMINRFDRIYEKAPEW